MPTSVAIAGITGKFSQCIIKALQQYDDVRIRGYCRSPQKLPKAILGSNQIDILEGIYNEFDGIRKFVRGSDVVICCYFSGPDVMIQGQKFLINACEKENVPRFIPIDYAVD